MGVARWEAQILGVSSYVAPLGRVAGPPGANEHVRTFEWRHLRFHVVTPDPMRPDQQATIVRLLPGIRSVTHFAALVGAVFERHVRIRTERPSPDIRFEVGS